MKQRESLRRCWDFKLILSTAPSDNELNQHALWICTEWEAQTHTHALTLTHTHTHTHTHTQSKVSIHLTFIETQDERQRLTPGVIMSSRPFRDTAVTSSSPRHCLFPTLYSLLCSVCLFSVMQQFLTWGWGPTRQMWAVTWWSKLPSGIK